MLELLRHIFCENRGQRTPRLTARTCRASFLLSRRNEAEMEDRSSRRVRRALQTPDCTDLQDTECPLERQNCLSRSTLTWLCQCLASQQVGRTKLQLERGGQLLPLCEFDVRKNRIVTVKLTVSAFERIPRCELKK